MKVFETPDVPEDLFSLNEIIEILCLEGVNELPFPKYEKLETRVDEAILDLAYEDHLLKRGRAEDEKDPKNISKKWLGRSTGSFCFTVDDNCNDVVDEAHNQNECFPEYFHGRS
ncbi:hypothetical protein OnM2_107018 [Erysiphe neolycopersici]|uniref:Uncharacterized protein n=1 Tax=Erysiphe neolycopersici TaxID=212602 RepID=A0A420H773_9PEZI|nr:hypothetical protein OnM2_107018 [Erysiphe neolycopersici]